MKDLNGKVAFVTGGASGIGLGLVRAFLNQGMNVVVADIRDDHLEEATQLLYEHGSHCHFMRLDVADRTAMAAAADEAERVFGKVHILCNNAGVGSHLPMDIATYADWDWTLGVNLGGVINGIVSFLPRLLRHGEGGHIVNTSSMAGLTPLPSWGGIYSTSKFAVRGLSDSLRLTLGPRGIGVTTLCPGLTRSNIRESEKVRPPALASNTADGAPEGSFAHTGMDPQELGEAVVRAIKRNDGYVLAHGENRASVQAEFDEVMSYFSMEPVTDPDRLNAMSGYEQMINEAKSMQVRA
ncbi:SDR family NAD(P)-dependent oxidoreductase [Massilia dura]|uniref:SDR family NAD(P)-dependent oxidoreductase n=1 Tax=Pseudoduganella dura TaxID=321982 RepID=A0A6I3X3G1_9BURK|nr:SDR family NAD(P)-dependent oxidoreductase [Pseudoduganella dura]MUI11389.1 SDR family NAD(P)-dependent oxidoreductase [Pseudoduganella dura]GGX95852.1 short-chain type dehydrogenase/reductase [Pseudoduganella dura]